MSKIAEQNKKILFVRVEINLRKIYFREVKELSFGSFQWNLADEKLLRNSTW